MSNDKKIIGLTGPIGSGKNEVAKILRRHGAHIIEADEIGHKLFVPMSDIWCKIVSAFGSKVLMRGGAINRHKLGQIVFSDPEKLKTLNLITHPKIKEAIEAEIKDKKGVVVINAALPQLFEELVDKTVVVAASKEKRLKRLLKQGLSKAEAEKRIKSQISQKDYLKIADVVIRNDGTIAQLKRLMKSIFQRKWKQLQYS